MGCYDGAILALQTSTRGTRLSNKALLADSYFGGIFVVGSTKEGRASRGNFQEVPAKTQTSTTLITRFKTNLHMRESMARLSKTILLYCCTNSWILTCEVVDKSIVNLSVNPRNCKLGEYGRTSTWVHSFTRVGICGVCSYQISCFLCGTGF